MRALITAAAALAGIAAVPQPAAAEPDNQDLVLAGLAMAPPTYLIGVTLHEGSHALAAELVGGDVTGMRLFPPGRDPRAKKFRNFGSTTTGIPSAPASAIAARITSGERTPLL